MPSPKRPSANVVRDFVANNVEDHPGDIVRLVSKSFGISRQSASNHLRRLVEEGTLEAAGRTRARKYKLRNFIEERFVEKVSASIQEDVEWRNKVLPLMNGLADNIIEICQHGFTEIVNNVIDHSESERFHIFVRRNIVRVELLVWDLGIGIFNKIQQDFRLEDPRHAVLELSKGKLTSDPTKHTGEGIFFTSRMFDQFSILSGELFFCSFPEDDDWLIEVENRAKSKRGTLITMKIGIKAKQTAKEIFRRYQDDDFRFSRTHVLLELVKYEGEQLVSRSQAKRLLARVDRFSEVILNFRGVSTIGQAFADEIFRVYQNEHLDMSIIAIRTTPEVRMMIDRTRSDGDAPEETQESLDL